MELKDVNRGFRQSGPNPIIAQYRVEHFDMSFGDCRDFFDFGLHVGVDAGLRMAIKAVQQTLDTAVRLANSASSRPLRVIDRPIF